MGYSDVQIDKIEHQNNGNLPQYHPDFVKIHPKNPPEKDSDEEEEILPDTNPPKNASKAESPLTMTQMQHPTASDQPDWSILSETISYHFCPSNKLDISPAKALDPPPPQDQTTPDPGDAPFFTPYEGVHCELQDPSMYDDLSDVSTTYLGSIEYDQHKPFFKATVSIDPRCIGKATLPNGDRLNVLFDTGASCSYMSYEYYRENKYLRSLTKYQPRAPTIFVCSRDEIPARFVIPLRFFVDNHCFKIYTLVCKLGVSDFIFGIKNIMETEGRICTQTLQYRFLNRSPSLRLTRELSLPADAQKRPVESKVDFPKDISGQAIIKLILFPKHIVRTLKVSVDQNILRLNISNHTKNPILYPANTSIGILDVRSLGYFHVSLDHME